MYASSVTENIFCYLCESGELLPGFVDGNPSILGKELNDAQRELASTKSHSPEGPVDHSLVMFT